MKLITPEQVAEIFSLRPRHVTDLARRGKIPSVKVGKLWRFCEEDLQRWVRNGIIVKDENEEKLINTTVNRIITETLDNGKEH